MMIAAMPVTVSRGNTVPGASAALCAQEQARKHTPSRGPWARAAAPCPPRASRAPSPRPVRHGTRSAQNSSAPARGGGPPRDGGRHLQEPGYEGCVEHRQGSQKPRVPRGSGDGGHSGRYCVHCGGTAERRRRFPGARHWTPPLSPLPPSEGTGSGGGHPE